MAKRKKVLVASLGFVPSGAGDQHVNYMLDRPGDGHGDNHCPSPSGFLLLGFCVCVFGMCFGTV